MAEKKAKTRGISAIARANAIDLVVFGAIHFHRSKNPDAEIAQTVKDVIQHFGIEGVSEEALISAYFRAQRIFIKQ